MEWFTDRRFARGKRRTRNCSFFANSTILAVSCLFLISQATEESSNVYLRNVANELQMMNIDVRAVEVDSDESSPISWDRLPHPPPLHPPPPTSPHNHLRSSFTTTQLSSPEAHLHPESQPQISPLLLGFSPAELASMYKQALEQGSPTTYDSLIYAINERTPKVTNPNDFHYGGFNKFEHETSPQYAYYFYPLQTFSHELTKSHGYNTFPNLNHNPIVIKGYGKKNTNMMNPLVVGISSLIGMALFFIIGMYFYPNFLHHINFPLTTTSRTIFQNELKNLVIFVTEAIDYHKRNV